jgi:uncharacterized protein YmfQ (DUF2313 family)
LTIPQLPRDRHVRRNGEDYTQAFLSLLPRGQAWPRYWDSTLVLTARGLCDYWGFVDSRAADLLETESDPRTTVELLPDWERNWGLPDPCFPQPSSIEERQKLLVMIMTMLGGQSRQWFQFVSEWTGHEVSIKEWSPFMAGLSECGDTRFEYDDTGDFRWYIGAEENRFYWSASSETAVIEWFRAGADYSESGKHHHCEIYTESPVDCLLQRWRPAHTQLVFDYSDLASDDPWIGLP